MYLVFIVFSAQLSIYIYIYTYMIIHRRHEYFTYLLRVSSLKILQSSLDIHGWRV